jgi:hypothetical protein
LSEQQTEGQEPAATPVVIESTTPDPWAAFPPEFNWVRKELEDTRKEAAEKRVLNKELQDKLGSAKTPEEMQQATAAYETKARDLDGYDRRGTCYPGSEAGRPEAGGR